jgi:protein-tyrosine phosphatase
VLSAAALVCLVAAAAPFGVARLSHLVGGSSLPNRWTEARAGWLYRSGQIPKRDVADVLRDQRIDVVIDLTDDERDATRDAEKAAAEKLGIRYLHLPVGHPQSAVIENLANAVAQIELARRRGDRVLVHCEYGHRRSAAALALYARIVEHEPRDVAYAEFSRYSEPDSNWSQTVSRFLDRNLDEIASKVRADLAAAPTP